MRTTPTDMSFSVSPSAPTDLEFSGASLPALFSQRSNLTSPRFYLMLADIVRFNTFFADLLTADPAPVSLTIGAYLAQHGYSHEFTHHYLLPLTASVWSTSPTVALEFPALTLAAFLHNHRLLNTLTPRPAWLTVPGGARRYIDALVAGIPDFQIHLGSPVKRVGTRARDARPYIVLESDAAADSGGSDGEYTYAYDHVVLAVHGPDALALLGAGATADERAALGAFHTREKVAVLHADRDGFLPRREEAWAAWNYLGGGARLTYNMNILQHIPRARFGDVLVTLNPPAGAAPLRGEQGRWTYRHPVFTGDTVRAQRAVERLQGRRGLWFAGAWTGYGFHEDGCRSGLRVAEGLGAGVPWGRVRGSERRVPRRGLRGTLRRLFVHVLCEWLVWVLGIVAGLLGWAGFEFTNVESKAAASWKAVGAGEKPDLNGRAAGRANGSVKSD